MMATNNYFNNYNYFDEQNLIDDLVIESIQIYGVDTYYVTRRIDSIDNIQNEAPNVVFDGAHMTEMYVKSVDGFQGEGDFMSKFGLQIRDQVTFTVAIRTFENNIIRYNAGYVRPKEGDLVYMPMNRKFFKITFVEHESVFYQTGALQVYDLKCELFEYSNERFETGVDMVDSAYIQYDTSPAETLDELYDIDPIAKNIFYENEGDTFIDFSEIDPFSEVISYSANTAV